MKKGIIGILALLFVFSLVSSMGTQQAQLIDPMPKSPVRDVAENRPPVPLNVIDVVENRPPDLESSVLAENLPPDPKSPFLG